MPQPPTAKRQTRRAKRAARPMPTQQPMPVYTAEPISTAVPTPNPFLTAEQEIPEHLTAETTTPTSEEPQISTLPSFTDREELRKAILYAEILQRKV